MIPKSAAIGPLMEQLVKMVTDIETLNGKMAKIESAFATLGASLTARVKYQRKPKPAEEAVEPALQVVTMPRRRHGKPYKRGPYLHKTPYKKTALIAASTSVNARLRHLGEDDPVRAKILKLRATKGHIAAHEFVEKMFPDRATFQKYRLKAAARVSTKTSTKTSTRTSTKTSMTGKAPRASAELRAKFAEAISKLPAEEQHRVLIRKRKEGIGPTLAWLGNGHGNGHAQVAEV